MKTHSNHFSFHSQETEISFYLEADGLTNTGPFSKQVFILKLFFCIYSVAGIKYLTRRKLE